MVKSAFEREFSFFSGVKGEDESEDEFHDALDGDEDVRLITETSQKEEKGDESVYGFKNARNSISLI
jgi:hypothetical protein